MSVNDTDAPTADPTYTPTADPTGNDTYVPTAAPTISDDGKLEASLTVAVPVFIVFLLCFLICRSKYPLLYMTNQDKVKDIELATEKQKPPKGDEEDEEEDEEDAGGVMGMFDVIVKLLKYDEDKIEAIAGFDAMVFTTLLWFQFKLFLVLAPIGCILLAPVYSAGDSGNGSFLQTIALANVGENDEWISYFTLVVALGIHVGSTKLLSQMLRRLSVKADKFKANPTESHCTVMITDIEDRLMKGKELANFLDRLYPGEVCNVDFCKDLKGVQKLWDTYKKAEAKRVRCEESEKKTVGCCCFKKDLEYCQKAEEEAKQAFYETDFTAMPTIPVAVVQFNTVKTATICSGSILMPGGHSMQALTVPENADQILWTNLSQKSRRKQLGSILGTILYVWLIIFYSPLMVFVQGVANLDNLASMWEGFALILDISPEARKLIQGSLPAILFSVFFMILPMYLAFLSSLCKMPFKTDENSLTLGRYADCLVGMGLLVSVLASGVLSSVGALNNLSPTEIWSSLGTEVPAQSIFFITYVVTACFISMAMSLAMVIPFIMNLIGLYRPSTFNYRSAYGVNIMMFTVCVTYAVVSPIILIWGCVYFFVAYFTYTYQLIFVYKRDDDTGGNTFPAVYGRLNTGMVIGQFVIIAMFVLIESTVSAAIFVLVPFYTLSTKSDSKKRYAYYFKKASVNTAEEEGAGKRNIVVEGENNFVAPPVKALQTRDNQKEDAATKGREVKETEEEPVESKKPFEV